MPALDPSMVVVESRALGHRVRAHVEEDGVPEEEGGRRGRSGDDGHGGGIDDADLFGGGDAVAAADPPVALPPLDRRGREEVAGGLVRVEHFGVRPSSVDVAALPSTDGQATTQRRRRRSPARPPSVCASVSPDGGAASAFALRFACLRLFMHRLLR